MTKNDVVKKISEITGSHMKDIGPIIDALWDVIEMTLNENPDEKITFIGVGSFKTKNYAAREGVSFIKSKDGMKWSKPAHREIVFAPTKDFKMIETEPGPEAAN